MAYSCIIFLEYWIQWIEYYFTPAAINTMEVQREAYKLDISYNLSKVSFTLDFVTS